MKRTVSAILMTLSIVGMWTFCGAIVPSTESHQATEKRIAEIDTSLQNLSTKLKKSVVPEAERKDLRQLEESLEKERKLLLDRAELLKRLERQGLLMYLNPPTDVEKKDAAQKKTNER